MENATSRRGNWSADAIQRLAWDDLSLTQVSCLHSVLKKMFVCKYVHCVH